MFLREISLLNFRNYQNQNIQFSFDTNIFFGGNAQGKTNLLEAIYLLATLQTFRASENKDFIRWNTSQSSIKGIFSHSDFERTYIVDIYEHGKKPKIDNKPIKKLEDYVRSAYITCFCPQDLQIIQGPPFVRRRYLDRSILGFDPLYAVQLRDYCRTVIQKNTALKMGDETMIELWEEKQLFLGAKILLKRLQFVEKLNTLTSYLYKEISKKSEEIIVKYESENNLNNMEILTESIILDRLKDRQKHVFKQERIVNRCLVGPHRDEFSVTISGKNIKFFGSQGEQRTAILAMKLSEVTALDQDKKVRPIFLLDDIASELDEKRKKALFSKLKERKTQIFVTTTDVKSLFLNEGEAHLFRVEEGNIRVQ